ncbi:MAG: ABC transporter family substrate-binding protein [Dermatophilaceae bacterium]|nr:ABC transporter family substrate-binding protein [Intrasporangiaceae bacterium]
MTRRTRILSMVAVGALMLTACASQDTGTESTDTGTDTDTAAAERSGGTLRVAETNAFTSFNNNVSANNLDINSKVLGTMRSDFIYLDNELNIVPDESFGTYEKVSDDPLAVKYTVNESSVWSDGNAIDKGDMLLQWAILSGHFDGEPNAEGAAEPAFFSYAGSTEGLSLTDMPEFEDDRTMTLTYSEPYVDWEISYDLGSAMPAHVVAEQAGLADEAALVELLETATPGEANEELQAVADFWNTGYVTNTMPSDESLLLSSGPMIVTDMVPEQSVTLAVNDAYGGDLPAQVDEITVRFIGDAAAAIAALRNGEVDIIAPQPTVDAVQEVQSIEDVTVLQGPQLVYDHLDLSFDSEVFADQNVREAFLKTIPRDVIVDRLIRPINENAEVVNSQLYLPSEGDLYTQAVSENGSDAYAEVDIEGARELLAGATPTVRILYNSNNPIRVDTFSIIQESATEAGFNIEDGGSADWGSELGGGGYDASIFGWISSGVGSAGIPQIFSTTGGGNYSGYSNPEVDALATELLVTSDSDEAESIKRQIDTLLWSDAYGVTLFQGPGLIVHSNDVEGVEYMSNQTGVWWNFWEWSLAS